MEKIMVDIIKFIINFGLVLLQAWIIICASSWFWPSLAITYSIALAALIIIRIVFNSNNILSNLHACDYFEVIDVSTNKVDDYNTHRIWAYCTVMNYYFTLWGWLILWIVYSLV